MASRRTERRPLDSPEEAHEWPHEPFRYFGDADEVRDE
jgi:hypothetical protein